MTTKAIKWNSERIYHLLQSTRGYRPYGVDKHFHMMFIIERFRQRTGLNVSADVLIEQMEEFYSIPTLTARDAEKSKQKLKSSEFTLPADFK